MVAFLDEWRFCRRQADQVQLLEEAIRQRSELQRKSGAELDATCQLCLKTKFADGLGHACHYCNARCCARCGGKVALRSSKVKHGAKWLLACLFSVSRSTRSSASKQRRCALAASDADHRALNNSCEGGFFSVGPLPLLLIGSATVNALAASVTAVP